MSAKQPVPLSGERLEPRLDARSMAPPGGGIMTGPGAGGGGGGPKIFFPLRGQSLHSCRSQTDVMSWWGWERGPPNTPPWQKEYFELKAIEKQQV